MAKRKGRLKWKNIILTLVLLLSIGGLIYSMINFIHWEKDNIEIKNNIENIDNATDVQESDGGEAVNSENESEESIYWSYIKMNMINVDLSELKNINKDTKGWIQVNGTNINYPYVQTTDNSYYLTHSFEKKYTDAGWIFMDYRNNSTNFDKNTILYGHARKDRTMFGSLKNILKSDWYNDTDNHIIKLSTETENTLWQVFSVYHIETESYYITTNFSSDKDYEKFLNTIKNRSALKFDANVNINDYILTLSTCYNNTDKVVLHAKLIKRENKN